MFISDCPFTKIFIYVPLCYVKGSQQNKCHKKWIKFTLLMRHNRNLQDNLTSMTLFLMLFPVVHLANVTTKHTFLIKGCFCEGTL